MALESIQNKNQKQNFLAHLKGLSCSGSDPGPASWSLGSSGLGQLFQLFLLSHLDGTGQCWSGVLQKSLYWGLLMLSQWLGGGLVGRPWSLLPRTVLWAYLQLPCSQIVTAGLVNGWLFISEEGMERVIRPLLKCQAPLLTSCIQFFPNCPWFPGL